MKIFQQKKSGIVGDLVSGTGALIVSVIVALVIISTLLGARLLSGTATVIGTGNFENVTNNTAKNFTAGINNVASKIPTILLIGAVVLLFGVIVLLVRQSQAMGIGGNSGSL